MNVEVKTTGELRPDEKMCRICLMGEDEGRFISPCKCSGTMKYVHSHCLEKWRTTSSNPKSFFQCDQCKFKYHFRRTTFGSMLRWRTTLHCLTLVILLLLVILGGYVFKLVDMLFGYEDKYWSSFLEVDLVHISFGLVFVGMSGFLSLLGGTGLFRMHHWGPRGGSDRSSKLELVIVGIIVFIGICKCAFSIYRWVEQYTKTLLRQAQDLVENIA